ncbi:MAG: hypothetical protein ACRDT0_01610 [Pseudonocardiaceae bacterium]
MGRHRARTGRSGAAGPRAQHRAHDDHDDGCAIGVIVISIAMLVFAGCTLVNTHTAAAVVAAVSLLIVAAWIRRHPGDRTGL